MPRLARVLHYRMLDISGTREALLMWQPELVQVGAREQCNRRILGLQLLVSSCYHASIRRNYFSTRRPTRSSNCEFPAHQRQ